MAWYPAATRMELQPESDAQAAIRPTQFIVHSIAAPWTARRTYEFWRDSTNLESHFGLGYAGDLGQFIGTETRADANAGANRRPDGTGAVSIETASNLQHSDPWTDEQVEALIELGVWLHQRHGIPLRICRTHDDPGYGYHRLHAAWSTGGTACPGDARVRQFKEAVFPEIVRRATGAAEEPDEPEQPAPTTPALEDPVAIPISESNPRAAQLPADGSWLDIAMADAVLVGPGETYSVVAAVQIDGLQQHAKVQTRFYYRNQQTGDRSYFLPMTHEVVFEVDDDRETVEFNTIVVHHPLTHRVPDGHDLRVQVSAKNPGGVAPAYIRHRTLHGLRGI
ncbi:N-acetylmuramoyl-L-alanine amidase [Streptomyces lavendulocolor]|uniref:N-acetylmuramoyl-L-alanine amidase n=1 Tax=Streptomyces lavendulocolor TaxID=67316 RepID=A0ABV2VY77_9ACTN